jgi:hypothetical protein
MEETVPKKVPDLELCDLRFTLQHGTPTQKEQAKSALFQRVKEASQSEATLHDILTFDT